MEVKIPKEIRDYRESIFFGLSARQFFCSLLAVGVAVGLYFGLRPLVGTQEVGWICILGAAPFAACRIFPVSRHDRRTVCLGMVQVGGAVSEETGVPVGLYLLPSRKGGHCKRGKTSLQSPAGEEK